MKSTALSDLKELIHDLVHSPGRRIGVLGDLMLDEYIYGTARRISPEAPVPVVEVERLVFHPGGAANVAENILALGAQPILFGVVGGDEFGGLLLERLQADGADTHPVLSDSSRPTTRKTRLIAHSQQVVRADHESTEPLTPELQTELLKQLEQCANRMDALIISDYDKGVLSPAFVRHTMSLVRQRGLRCFVDPKGRSVKRFRGAFLVKPGKQEAERIAALQIKDEESLRRAAHKIFALYDCSHVVITEGAQGMTVFSRPGRCTRIPAASQDVYDVTGAGDTVMATLAVAMTARASPLTAARLATLTAGIVVRKVGTAVSSLAEVEEFLEQDSWPK